MERHYRDYRYFDETKYENNLNKQKEFLTTSHAA